jgi:microbial collagenase
MKFWSLHISLRLVACCCAFVFGSLAHANDWQRLDAMPADVRLHTEPHVQARPLTPDQQPPLPATRKFLRQSYDDPSETAPMGDCDLSVLATATAAELPDLVRATDIACLVGLFYLSGADAAPIVGETKMTAVADAFHDDASNYTGDNSGGIQQLILFLRAGYYLQFFYPGDISPYGSGLVNALRPALDAFVANAHFHDINDDHGAVLT